MPDSEKPGYRILRASAGYSVVLLVTPADAREGAEGATYYEYHPGRPVPNWKSNDFNEVSWKKDAQYLFSGMSDGMGFGELPNEPFPSIAAALAFVLAKRGMT